MKRFVANKKQTKGELTGKAGRTSAVGGTYVLPDLRLITFIFIVL
jgi:hypothetical protein